MILAIVIFESVEITCAVVVTELILISFKDKYGYNYPFTKMLQCIETYVYIAILCKWTKAKITIMAAIVIITIILLPLLLLYNMMQIY